MPLPFEFLKQHDDLRPSQVELLASCFELYAARGLYRVEDDGREAPLCDICQNRASCWSPVWLDRNQGTSDGIIALPHVGPNYTADGAGVVVLGVNFNDANGLGAALGMAEWEGEAFKAGKRKLDFGDGNYKGSMFQFGSTTCATTLIRHIDATPDEVDPSGDELATTLDRIARLQAVKCSPQANRGEPSHGMTTNCPPMILVDELDILRPRHVLAFGDVAFYAIEALDGASVDSWERPLRRAHIHRDWGDVEAWGLYHPTAPNGALWRKSHEALRVALVAR